MASHTATGLDQIMPGNDDFLEHDGYVDLAGEIGSKGGVAGAAAAAERIDLMAGRVLRGMIGSGAWDRPTCTVGCDCQQFTEGVNAKSAANVALARRVAAASAVLLKNDVVDGGGESGNKATAARPVLPIQSSARIG